MNPHQNRNIEARLTWNAESRVHEMQAGDAPHLPLTNVYLHRYTKRSIVDSSGVHTAFMMSHTNMLRGHLLEYRLGRPWVVYESCITLEEWVSSPENRAKIIHNAEVYDSGGDVTYLSDFCQKMIRDLLNLMVRLHRNNECFHPFDYKNVAVVEESDKSLTMKLFGVDVYTPPEPPNPPKIPCFFPKNTPKPPKPPTPLELAVSSNYRCLEKVLRFLFNGLQIQVPYDMEQFLLYLMDEKLRKGHYLLPKHVSLLPIDRFTGLVDVLILNLNYIEDDEHDDFWAAINDVEWFAPTSGLLGEFFKQYKGEIGHPYDLLRFLRNFITHLHEKEKVEEDPYGFKFKCPGLYNHLTPKETALLILETYPKFVLELLIQSICFEKFPIL